MQLELASRETRFIAAFVDALLIGTPIIVALTTEALLGRPGAGGGKFGPTNFVDLGVGTLGTLAVLGVNLLLVHKYGQSIAKRWFGLKVVRSDGSRADVGRIVLLRNGLPMLIGAVPLVGSFFELVDALFIFRKDQRCIHDHMADTIVVRVQR